MVPAMSDFLRVEVDGVAVNPEVVASMESRVGHFTAMQVRGGKRAESPCICRGWKRPSFQAADRVARL